MALAEVALVGMTDFRPPSRYKREMNEKNNKNKFQEISHSEQGAIDKDQIESVSNFKQMSGFAIAQFHKILTLVKIDIFSTFQTLLYSILWTQGPFQT